MAYDALGPSPRAGRTHTQKGPGFAWKPGPFAGQATGRRLDLVAAATARSGIAGTATGSAARLSAEAVGAVNGPIATRREGHFGVLATLSANHRVHLAFATAVAAGATVAAASAEGAAAVTRSLAGGAAVGATAGGAEALGLVEFLFALGERELLCAVGASKVLV